MCLTPYNSKKVIAVICKKIFAASLSLFVCILAATPAAAQRQQLRPSRTTTTTRPPVQQRIVLPPPITRQQDASVESADLSITATVRAKELTFEVVPSPTVEFPGKPVRETVWDAERENLPRPVQPGVTYRDIGIRLKITSRFADIERIVAEALGEVPVTDEMRPENIAPPEQRNTTTPPPNSQPNGGRPR